MHVNEGQKDSGTKKMCLQACLSKVQEAELETSIQEITREAPIILEGLENVDPNLCTFHRIPHHDSILWSAVLRPQIKFQTPEKLCSMFSTLVMSATPLELHTFRIKQLDQLTHCVL